ncbi:MAG TPA: radical SAM family heme chaperone HemW [Anaerolineales bacterium]|nr:radical SAM family heme chaperone HemW [Anaerolineales bacterium]
MPLSLYLHIPFCTTRCSYCDFNTYAGLEDRIPAYVEALATEIDQLGERLRRAPVEGENLAVHTVYFGGGTPSLLPAGATRGLLAAVRRAFDLAPDAEVTLEANPGSLTLEYLCRLRESGVDRLSMGAQSAVPGELALLGRTHSFADVAQSVENARAAGFDNVSLDLILGLPSQSLESWSTTLDRAVALRPNHLSVYSLSLEFGTPLRAWVDRGIVPAPDSDVAADMYELAGARLESCGFVQYEISNWARPRPGADLDDSVERATFASRHNLQYWRNLPYLGFGAGAHGCARGWRYANVRSPDAYVRAVNSGRETDPPASGAVASRESVSETTARAETMLLGLRLTREGVAASAFAARHGLNLETAFGEELRRFRDQGLVEWSRAGARLTPRGRLLGNLVFQAFV